MLKGLPITKVVQCNFEELPQKLFDLLNELNKLGTLKVKATYHVWNTEKDGSPVTYRFIQGNMFDKWEVVKSEIKEEKVA